MHVKTFGAQGLQQENQHKAYITRGITLIEVKIKVLTCTQKIAKYKIKCNYI